ncbi:hypothetical protein [Streptomyces sp. CC0208]
MPGRWRVNVQVGRTALPHLLGQRHESRREDDRDRRTTAALGP